MKIIETSRFSLAVNVEGDTNADKLAIVIPGRLESKDYAHIVSHIEYLASLGYLSVSFDPPGTWDSPQDIAHYSITNTITSINDIIDYFDNRPTILVGHSRGGTNAMLAGAPNPNVTHMIAIMSPHGPTNEPLPENDTDVRRYTQDLPPGTIRTTNQKVFYLPYSYFKDQIQHDSLPVLKNSKKPKLFFYGEDDIVISKDVVRHMYEVAAEPKVLHALKTEHNYRMHPEAIQEVNRAIGAFLKNYV